MKVNGKPYRTIWLKEGNDRVVQVIDQLKLPHAFEIAELASVADMCRAISNMTVRGAGLIGASAGFGMYLAALEAPEQGFHDFMRQAAAKLKATRPTAANLAWAVERMLGAIALGTSPAHMRQLARDAAVALADEDAEHCRRLGEHGLALIAAIAQRKPGQPVNILTHCNAGWLAFVDFGSATAPIYAAHDAGIAVHVWVDETRPRNQGASLTAWELGQHGVPHTLIADNAGGHLMQHGLVDMLITGTDRVTRSGDVANKIGTYLKALAARDNGIPMFVALPSSTFDFTLRDGVASIPIEERGADEVRFVSGKANHGGIETVQICPDTTPARNWGFDVTPARLVTKLICERGICDANEAAILALFPHEKQMSAPTDDGVIKYSSLRVDGTVEASAQFDELNTARTTLFDLGLIGAYPNGIGYGNLSLRTSGQQFLITASATGAMRQLRPDQFCLVESFSISHNSVRSRGTLEASSESMTHGAIYAANPAVGCVMHVHSRLLFDALLARHAPHTSADIPYGTPAMARAVAQLVAKQPGLPVLFVMAGHDEGIVAYGADIGSVLALLVDTLNRKLTP
jgi:methylthioribose-1-phosphate isomerase